MKEREHSDARPPAQAPASDAGAGVERGGGAGDDPALGADLDPDDALDADTLFDGLDDPSDVCRLVAEGLEGVEREGRVALDRLCAEHPDHAEELRRRISALAGVGLVEDGRRFGHYRVVRTLGRGGMGVVYLVRDERMDRLVALKALPERLVPNDRARARLQREIRAVAQLSHRAIVPIYDVGEEDGAPFFTMEWVDGRTLAELIIAAKARGLPPEQLSAVDLDSPDATRGWVETACRLVQIVARGLHHAHQHGVVHRDIKPQNIMVGHDGRPRLFDFGLARLEGEAGLTLTGDLAGTPFYLSPEAASARRVELDARTDVYSLGVTLYELLTLQVPFAGRTTEEVLRQIAVREPPLLRRLNADVSRDLETICLTAMEKDPNRRYASAEAFSDDITRLLSFRPVQARPVGTLVRGWRATRRRPALAASVLLGLVILIGTPVGLFLANRAIAGERDAAELAATVAQQEWSRAETQSARAQAESERALAESDRARDEEEKAKQAAVEADAARARADAALSEAQSASEAKDKVVEFLLAMLMPTNPTEVDHDLTVSDVLHRGADTVGSALAGEPRLQASVRQSLGNAFIGLGEFDPALQQFTAAWDLVQAENDPSLDDSLAVSLGNLVIVHTTYKQYDQALQVGQAALDVNARLYGDDSLEVSDVLSNLAIVADRMGESEHAEIMFRRVIEIRSPTLGEDHARVAETYYNLGLCLPWERREEKAQLFDRALQIQRKVLPDDDPNLAMTLGGLAELHHNNGDKEQALAVQEEGVAILIRRLGELHPDVATASTRLAFMHIRYEQYPQAEPLLRRAVEGYTRAFPNGHTRRLGALKWLASILAAMERPHEAEPFLDQAWEEFLRVSADDDDERVTLVKMRADLAYRLGRPEEADALLAQHPDVDWTAGEDGSTP
jgi:serine/threonine protein kinase/tetratricopeptide (TPR) repeat protein